MRSCCFIVMSSRLTNFARSEIERTKDGPEGELQQVIGNRGMGRYPGSSTCRPLDSLSLP
jgi:hypothetical protein